MKPLKLDDSSTKKEPDFGDVLYIIKKEIFSFFYYNFVFIFISLYFILGNPANSFKLPLL